MVTMLIRRLAVRNNHCFPQHKWAQYTQQISSRTKVSWSNKHHHGHQLPVLSGQGRWNGTAAVSSSERREHRRSNSNQQQQQQHQQRRRRQRQQTLPNKDNKILFQSLGCPRNFVDTEVMLGVVLQAGMEVTQSVEDADYLVINTCGFLQAARDESKATIQQLLQEKKKSAKLLVTGCMVNLHKEQIMQDYPQVDHVLGSGSIDKVLQAIQSLNQQPLVDATMSISEARKSFLEQADTPRFLATPPHYAYLKIAEGCRKRCSFCIIPKIKGRLQSKPISQIIQEFQALVHHGVSEVILIAQDLGDYGKDFPRPASLNGISNSNNNIGNLTPSSNIHKKPSELATLLRSILETEGLPKDFWLRLLYLYPDEITPDILDVMESDSRICRYLDMPIQHSHDVILKSMRRKTTSDDIRQTIQTIRQRLPGIHIRTSLMVGFPGETEEHFQHMIDFVLEYELDNVGVFQYSNEEMAFSSRLPNHVPEEVKEDRYHRLMQAQLEVVQRKNKKRVDGQERLEVVIEGMHPDHKDLIVGRYYGQCPDIDGQVIINDVDALGKLPNPGQRYWVELTDFDNYDLIGRIIAPTKSL